MRSSNFAIQQSTVRHRDDPSDAVDREPPGGIVIQRVRDRAERAIRISRERSVAHRRTVARVFIDRIGGAVTIADRRDPAFVHVCEINRERANAERRVSRGGSHGDTVRRGRFIVQLQTIGYGDSTRHAVDDESASRVVIQ